MRIPVKLQINMVNLCKHDWQISTFLSLVAPVEWVPLMQWYLPNTEQKSTSLMCCTTKDANWQHKQEKMG
ncbi:hypothetical protein EMIT0P43_30258 [Pseudomonas jessenii]